MASGSGTSKSLEVRHLSSTEGFVMVKILGELDIASAPLLRGAMDEARGDVARDVVADFADVTFMDSSGLQALIDVQASYAANDCSLRIRGLSEPLAKLFEMTGADRLFLIEP